MSTQHNQVYPAALEAFMAGEVDLMSAAVKAVLLSGSYTYDPEHVFLDDIDAGARLDESPNLDGKAITGGRFTADPAVFPSVGPGPDIEAVVVFVDSGSDATSRLLSFIGRRADTVPLLLTDTDGGSVTLTWPNHVFRI